MNNEQTVEFSQIQIEKIEKNLAKALAVSVVLENELGVQRDAVSADVVCVIKELIMGVRDMIKTVSENESTDEDKQFNINARHSP